MTDDRSWCRPDEAWATFVAAPAGNRLQPSRPRRWAQVVFSGGLLAAFLALAGPLTEARAQAESSRAVFEVRAGASSPKGDLGDAGDDGQLLSLRAGYRLFPRLTLGLEGTLQNLERGGDPAELGGGVGPDIELWHYMAVASLELTDSVRSRWEVVLHGGAGGTRVESDATERLDAVSADEPTVLAAVDGGYDFSPHVTLFFRADGYLLLGDTSDPGKPFLGKEVVLTHTGGLRFSF